MNARVLLGSMIGCLSVLAGCSSDGGGTNPAAVYATDPAAFTVSYRNQVRLPGDGAPLTADRYAQQIKAKDPIGAMRCGAETTPAYNDLTSFLGGIAWTHPMAIVKDASFPPLYAGKPDMSPRGEAANAAGASDKAAAPNIERPDLVGIRNGIAVFLSKQHGLLAVDARGGTPVVTCAMKIPGAPMSFFVKGDEIVVIVNALNGFNRAALVRYSFANASFRYLDAVQLPNQHIEDARLFDSTIVAYTDWTKERPQPPVITDPPVLGNDGTKQGTGVSVYGSGGSMGGGDMAAPSQTGYYNGDRIGSKVIVVQWDDALGLDWQDSLIDDPTKQDPMEGLPPDTKFTPGQVVSTWTNWKPFVAASDRYIAIPRSVTKTKFVEYATYNYQVCTAYNPQDHQIESCSTDYEKRPNPDYRAPDPATGDYSCNGQSLADCITQAAPVVSQYVYVPVGQHCSMVWIGACTKYENRSETYPRFEQETETGLTVYRFENNSFVKLDDSLSTMVDKSGALAFDKTTLSVKGDVQNKDQIQFQNGHLYVFADQALQTMAVAGNSVAYVKRLDISASTNNSPSIAFSTDRAMISAVTYSYPPSSNVEMIDLSVPALPVSLKSFTMPGASTQLMLATGGILGPGQVNLGNTTVVGEDGQSNVTMPRTLEKMTLFSRDDGHELDNLLLGTEYNAFETSYFSAEDDQRIRLAADGTRVFLPYSGKHHADPTEPTAHRLNISRVDAGRLVSERSFEVSDDVIRTAAIDDQRSLVFADSATYLVDHTSGDWALSTLRETFVPFATYRLADSGLLARVDRVGSKCRVSTFPNDAAVFGDAALAQAEIACPEGTIPTGFGPNLFFSQTLTGVRFSPDGLQIIPLTPADVTALAKKVPQNVYCWINGDVPSSGTVDFLDAVPSKIDCATPPQD
jgi:hypothetical protein